MNAKRPLHPDFDELLALVMGELPPDRAEEVREHLLECPECLAQARELVNFSDRPPSPEQEIGEAEVEAAWRRLQVTVGEEEAGAPAPPVPNRPFEILPGRSPGPATTPRQAPFRPRGVYALLAAAVTALAIGGYWLFSPSPETTWTGLQLQDQYRLIPPDAEPERLKCPPAKGRFGVRFAITSGETPKRVWVGIATPEGRLVHEPVELRPDQRGVVQFPIERSWVPDGRYELQVHRDQLNGPLEVGLFEVECQP